MLKDYCKALAGSLKCTAHNFSHLCHPLALGGPPTLFKGVLKYSQNFSFFSPKTNCQN